jgi:hypothetical protein
MTQSTDRADAANKHCRAACGGENSTRSIISLVICTLPDSAVPLAHPLCRPPLKLGRTVTVAVQILAILAAFVGAWVGFSLQFCIRKVGIRLDFAS